jgi:sugar O-acyltransferase (sialic acid O-acetyltransferase NeuD family)
MIKKDIILIGGGGHCRSCIDVIELEGKFNIIGIVDLPEKIGENILNYPIIASDSDLVNFINKEIYFFITIGQIGSAEKRISIYSKLKSLNVNIPFIISPDSYVSKYSTISRGTIIMHNCIVNACSIIGENCIINNKALIEHDVTIGSHCHISTGAIINGGVNVGEGTFFGSGAVSKHYIDIPNNSFVKANSIYSGTK